MPDLRSCCAKFVVQGLDIFSIDPDPASGISLIAFGEEEAAFPARDGDEKGILIRKLKIDFEAERARVVVNAEGCVAYAEDRGDLTQLDFCHCCCCFWRHGSDRFPVLWWNAYPALRSSSSKESS